MFDKCERFRKLQDLGQDLGRYEQIARVKMTESEVRGGGPILGVIAFVHSCSYPIFLTWDLI